MMNTLMMNDHGHDSYSKIQSLGGAMTCDLLLRTMLTAAQIGRTVGRVLSANRLCTMKSL